MPEFPLVSVGMPVYNGERFLAETLDSLLAQDYPNLEVVISDNASSDSTWEICRQYAATDKRIRLHRNTHNIGILANFRLAMHLSDGPYFMWAAHDDLWEPSCISTLASVLGRYEEVVLACSDYDIVYRLSGDRAPHGLRLPSLSVSNSVFTNAMWMLTYLHPSFMYALHRASALRQTSFMRGYRQYDFADQAMLNELSLMGQVHLVPEVLYHAGVKEKERAPWSMSPRRLRGLKFAYGRFYAETLRSIRRSECISLVQKAALVAIFTDSFLNLSVGHERESVPRPLRLPIHLGLAVSHRLVNRLRLSLAASSAGTDHPAAA